MANQASPQVWLCHDPTKIFFVFWLGHILTELPSSLSFSSSFFLSLPLVRLNQA